MSTHLNQLIPWEHWPAEILTGISGLIAYTEEYKSLLESQQDIVYNQ